MNRSALWTSLLVITACEQGYAPAHDPAPLDPLPAVRQAVRTIARGHWDTAYTVGGAIGDTTLLMPRTLVGGDGWIAAFDYGDNTIKRFDAAGHLAWTSGGTGGGPGEFRGNFGLQVDRQGRIWAADPDLARLSAIGDTGALELSIPLSMERLAAVAIVDNAPVAISTNSNEALARIDSSGKILQRRPPPLEFLTDLPDFARSVVAASNGGPVWALAYPYGNLLVVHEGLEVRCLGKLVTGQPFPTQPIREPVFSVSAIALTDSAVVVLGNGGGPGRNRHLDRYSLADCRYLDSRPLPDRFSAMAYDGMHFVLERNDPAPQLVALTWTPDTDQ